MQKLHKMKIVMLGESGAGKTCIITRFIKNDFQSLDSTDHATFESQTLVSSDKKYELKQIIWDTAGQEIYRSLSPFYYRDADGVVFVYDITNKRSFEELVYWIGQVKQNGKENILMTIAANKSDLIERTEVEVETGKDFAETHGASFFLVSSKEDVNITDMFVEMGIRKFPHIKDSFKSLAIKEDSSYVSKEDRSEAKKGTSLRAHGKKDNSSCC